MTAVGAGLGAAGGCWAGLGAGLGLGWGWAGLLGLTLGLLGAIFGAGAVPAYRVQGGALLADSWLSLDNY